MRQVGRADGRRPVPIPLRCLRPRQLQCSQGVHPSVLLQRRAWGADGSLGDALPLPGRRITAAIPLPTRVLTGALRQYLSPVQQFRHLSELEKQFGGSGMELLHGEEDMTLPALLCTNYHPSSFI